MPVPVSALDTAHPPRPGETLDPAALLDCLQPYLPELAGPLVIEQFPAGHSNLTYAITGGGREYVLRRPPFGAEHIRAGHDMQREFRVLSGLYPVYGRVPQPVCYIPAEASPFGAPFYVMTRIRGIILRTSVPEGVVLEADTMRQLSINFMDNLAHLHAVDVTAAGLQDLYRGAGYVRRQVEGWVKRYRAAQTDDVPVIEKVIAWVTARIPEDSAATLIHNDYKYDNVILDPTDITQIRAVLDWEMATVGDPLTDVATALAYWVERDDPPEVHAMSFGLTALPGNLTRTELMARYAEVSRRNLRDMQWHQAFAYFKVAVIVQQIYFRYAKGFTRDERFARMGDMARLFAELAQRVLDGGATG
ncbi:MAG: phosphotransferase family protein [Chloracidobacterium sp.]|uniref:Phosphotransferase family protein n=1 Tax=Chloracidobacterium validum TaxID=2821543 RepID=A0ABX8BFN9_9BACT|nr:phosphotransferase family protein [Chloracidobacterium validum]QUW04438.1 phosphotransferase family protein [Chloracidobacterium validum]